MSNTSKKELERIVSYLFKYTLEFHLGRDEGIGYLLSKLGYRKDYYIPPTMDNSDLHIMNQLSWSYMRKYSISVETFIYELIKCDEWCSSHGFQLDLDQTKFINGDGK
jgi:hypothetical protein